MSEPSDLTQLLQEASQGDTAAFDRLYGVVYDELVALARAVRRRGAPETLNTTSLVHEAYFKLVRTPGNLVWDDKKHFFAVASRAMREVLVTAARSRLAQKRGGNAPKITIDDDQLAAYTEPEDVIALHEALDRLSSKNERQARIIEYRFFAGLSVEETARALDISDRTVKRDARFARAWLGAQLDRT